MIELLLLSNAITLIRTSYDLSNDINFQRLKFFHRICKEIWVSKDTKIDPQYNEMIMWPILR